MATDERTTEELSVYAKFEEMLKVIVLASDHSLELHEIELESKVATEGLLFEKSNVTAQVGEPCWQIIGAFNRSVKVALPPALNDGDGAGELKILEAKEDSAKTICEPKNRPVTNNND